MIINVDIQLVKFSELVGEARSKAMEEHRVFLAMDDVDLHYSDGVWDIDVISSIEANNYWFFKDGTLADTITYCGAHPKAGTTELKLFNKIYIIEK